MYFLQVDCSFYVCIFFKTTLFNIKKWAQSKHSSVEQKTNRNRQITPTTAQSKAKPISCLIEAYKLAIKHIYSTLGPKNARRYQMNCPDFTHQKTIENHRFNKLTKVPTNSSTKSIALTIKHSLFAKKYRAQRACSMSRMWLFGFVCFLWILSAVRAPFAWELHNKS